MAGVHCDSLTLLPAALAVIITECKTIIILTLRPDVDRCDASSAHERTAHSITIEIALDVHSQLQAKYRRAPQIFGWDPSSHNAGLKAQAAQTCQQCLPAGSACAENGHASLQGAA